jgi:hypothetical protein
MELLPRHVFTAFVQLERRLGPLSSGLTHVDMQAGLSARGLSLLLFFSKIYRGYARVVSLL